MEVQIDWFADWLSPVMFLLLVCVFVMICLALSDSAKSGRWQTVTHYVAIASAIGSGVLCAVIGIAFCANAAPPISEQIEKYYGIELDESESAVVKDVVAGGSYNQYASLLKVNVEGKTGYMIGEKGNSDDLQSQIEAANSDSSVRYIIVPGAETDKKDDGYVYRHIELYEYNLSIANDELTELSREMITSPF